MRDVHRFAACSEVKKRTCWQNDVQRRNIAIRVQLDCDEVPPVLGNAHELREVYTNLILNAVDAMPSGGDLTLRCCSNGDVVQSEVVDTGVGIAPEDQKVVFEEFKRLGKRGKGTKRGLGLGLAIVDRIAKLLDHEIRMHSEIDRGSTFEVLVPRADRADAVPAFRGLVDKAPASSLDGTIILCVDNEHTILEGMHGLLSKWGASPLIANNSETALEHLRRLGSNGGGYPSILLVDYHLDDDVTGIEVIDELREFAETSIPAIIVTADHTQDVREVILESGHALLHKPLKPVQLRSAIHQVLSSHDAVTG